MEISNRDIDAGTPFDWGRTSEEYARYRDIYPPAFYRKITDRRLCVRGQTVLDLGTGTGVLPRNLYPYGARWVGTDISGEQIEQAKKRARRGGMQIDFYAAAAEDLPFPPASFDVVTACQCFWYFDADTVIPRIADLLKADGKWLILSMMWLPGEDPIAKASEDLVLKYNPRWSGGGEIRRPILVPEIAFRYFEAADHEEYDIKVPFTRETWHGRMKTCRGVGASLSADAVAAWEKEHLQMLEKCAPEHFEILHYAALAVLKKRSL